MKLNRAIFPVLAFSTFLCLASTLAGADEKMDAQLLRAVNLNDAKEAEAWLAKGANPNYAPDQKPLLNLAAQGGYTHIVQILIDAKADLNARDDNAETAVMRAAESEKPEALSLLVKGKAALDVQNARGETALIMAATNHNPAMVKSLVEGGADVALKTAEGNTAVMSAALTNASESAEIISILAKAKADLNSGNLVHTPLSYAVSQDLEPLVKALLDGGADPNLHAESGSYPLALAFLNDSPKKIVDQLLRAKANPNITGSSGQSPLHMAAEKGLLAEAEALIKSGADINAKDNSGETALLTAKRNEHADVADLLIKSGAAG